MEDRLHRSVLSWGMRPLLLLTLLLAFARPNTSHACTTFALDGPKGPVVGKSYDWFMGQGLLIANPAGRQKVALLTSRSTPARWTAKYGSLTFNQYGHELPNGGMNEAGLVVEIMWLKQARHEPVDARPAINELQWIQMQLDLHSSVKQVIQHAKDVRIERVSGLVHYLVCDKTGACASFEHLNGALVIEPQAQPRALTNHPYAVAKAHSATKKAKASGHGSLARFSRAASASTRRHEDPVAAAWQVLEGVQIDNYTQWGIVYEPKTLRVHFRTRAQPALKSVQVKAVLPTCAKGPFALDIDDPGSGDVSELLVPLGEGRHRALVSTSLRRSKDRAARQLIGPVSRLGASFGCTP